MSARTRSSSVSQKQASGSWNGIFSKRTHNRDRSIATDDPFEKQQYRNTILGSSMTNPQNMNNSVKSRYIKIAAFLSIALVVIYMIGRPASIEGPSFPSVGKNPIHENTGRPASDPTTGTTKCLKSSSKSKPIVQYAIMVDAGSTGSRIHVYRFNNCGNSPELEDETFEMIKPGLSSYKADALGAAKSLDELLDVAVQKVPKKLAPCTPIAVKATAGLRMLGLELSNNILAAVRTRLETEYPFPVVKGDGVSIMEGKDEGVYAWITTNYLLGKIGGPDESPTAAIFDLGGGSTQIVFQPTFPKLAGGGMPEELAPGDHHYDLNFGGRSFDLYQYSHLGYGLMEARKAIHKAVVQAKYGDSPVDKSVPIINPCIAPGMSRIVELEINSVAMNITMTGPSTPSAAMCRQFAESILFKDKDCNIAPCSFNGVHQPSISKTFAREDVYIFSYFFDRTEPLGMPSSFTLEELRDLTAKVCEGEAGWANFGAIKGALEELRDRPEHCLDLNFEFALLHSGYDMPLHREVKIAKKIKGNELGWCLGASLPLLAQESGWKCKITETH